MAKPSKAPTPNGVQVSYHKIDNGYVVTRTGVHRGKPYEKKTFSPSRPTVSVTTRP